jgi:hypothetical protein
MNESLSDELQKIVSPGLARDPIRHAEQIATIAGVLYRAFDDSGLRSVVVGGSAIEIHAPGTYVSGDIDLVVERLQQQDVEIDDVFSSLGFQRKGRHWRIGDLFVEVPSRILSDRCEVMRVGSAVFEVVRKEVVLPSSGFTTAEDLVCWAGLPHGPVAGPAPHSPAPRASALSPPVSPSYVAAPSEVPTPGSPVSATQSPAPCPASCRPSKAAISRFSTGSPA